MHFLSFIFGPMASFNRLAVGPLFFLIIYIIVVDKKINIVQNNECKENKDD